MKESHEARGRIEILQEGGGLRTGWEQGKLPIPVHRPKSRR